MAQRLLTMWGINEPMNSGHGAPQVDYQPLNIAVQHTIELGFLIIRPPHNRKMLFK
jgi:hypothetical protein